MEFANVKKELKEIQEQIRILKNKEYELNINYTKSLKEESKKNIGRCFKKLIKGKVTAYCQIINIDKGFFDDRGNEYFNQCQYPSLWFSYPYQNYKMPFYRDDLFSGAWGKGNDFLDESRGITYEEITKEEFNEKFLEVNSLWIEKIKN